MNRIEINKDKPNVFFMQHPIDGYYMWGAHFMLRKFKGGKTATYRGSGQAQVVAIDKLPHDKVVTQLTKVAENSAKQGRYHDWMWQPAHTAYIFKLKGEK